NTSTGHCEALSTGTCGNSTPKMRDRPNTSPVAKPSYKKGERGNDEARWWCNTNWRVPKRLTRQWPLIDHCFVVAAAAAAAAVVVVAIVCLCPCLCHV